MDTQIIASQCKATPIINFNPEATFLDAGDQLLLLNLPRHWILVCKPDNRPFVYKTYTVISRMELCECTMSVY